MAIENGPFEDVFPIFHMGIFQPAMSVYNTKPTLRMGKITQSFAGGVERFMATDPRGPHLCLETWQVDP